MHIVAADLKTRQGLKPSSLQSSWSGTRVAADLKTRQGLKLKLWLLCTRQIPLVAADLKTRQGLKLTKLYFGYAKSNCCSGLENPTGIETLRPEAYLGTHRTVAADLKTRQGLKHHGKQFILEGGYVAADLKTRQGLKLYQRSSSDRQKARCSGLENPTGIETKLNLMNLYLFQRLQRT